jgi:hypothetical protein
VGAIDVVIFPRHENGLAAEAMAQRVEAGAVFAFGRRGPVDLRAQRAIRVRVAAS